MTCYYPSADCRADEEFPDHLVLSLFPAERRRESWDTSGSREMLIFLLLNLCLLGFAALCHGSDLLITGPSWPREPSVFILGGKFQNSHQVLEVLQKLMVELSPHSGEYNHTATNGGYYWWGVTMLWALYCPYISTKALWELNETGAVIIFIFTMRKLPISS